MIATLFFVNSYLKIPFNSKILYLNNHNNNINKIIKIYLVVYKIKEYQISLLRAQNFDFLD